MPVLANIKHCEAELLRHPDGIAGERALRSRERCLHRRNCSKKSAEWSSQIAELCFWMRSATSQWSCSQSCCAHLQEREFERLGSNRTIKSDFRLIAATLSIPGQVVHLFRSKSSTDSDSSRPVIPI